MQSTLNRTPLTGEPADLAVPFQLGHVCPRSLGEQRDDEILGDLGLDLDAASARSCAVALACRAGRSWRCTVRTDAVTGLGRGPTVLRESASLHEREGGLQGRKRLSEA